MSYRINILLFLITLNLFADQPKFDKHLNFQDIELRLKNELVVQSKGIRSYLRETGRVVKGDDTIQLITLESGLKAVFKPGEYRFAEVAAYRASLLLSLRLVPPTVFRVINGVEGSLQFFVESPIDLLKGNNREIYFKKIDPQTLSDMIVFYFVFGQWDLHAGNQIIVQHDHVYYLALIDNAGMLHKQHIRYGDFAFIQKGENVDIPCVNSLTFPFDKVKTIKNRPLNELIALFKPFIKKEHIEKIWNRKKPITYVFWNNAFWMQMYRYNPSVKPLITKKYNMLTLMNLKALTREKLTSIWHECYEQEPEYYADLIDLIQERINQILAHAHFQGFRA